MQLITWFIQHARLLAHNTPNSNYHGSNKTILAWCKNVVARFAVDLMKHVV